ncbi:MAG: transporter [Saprospiraceae bacterium]|nr:transporter [Saprospiraceae bacterium]
MKKITYTLAGILLMLTLSQVKVTAQGCVAIRGGMGCTGTAVSGTNLISLSSHEWQVGLNYRYFRSFRHFRGDVEEANRVLEHTEVVNLVNNASFNVSYGLTNRFSLGLNLPVSHFDRSSLYEHYGNSESSNPSRSRFHTQSSGIGDLRLTGTTWLWDPADHYHANMSVGVGIKAPTGNANVQDDFHKLDAEGQDYIVSKAVDQSIQLGDGGWGFNLEAQGFTTVSSKLALYFSGFYLFNPKNYNETLTRGTLVNADPLTAYHSVADQYAFRAGVSFALLPKQGILFNLGANLEGIPAKDVLGKDEGFRRPGYVVSVDPGLFYAGAHSTLELRVPIALYRNRILSVSDIASGRHGDAAFADFLVELGASYRFGGTHLNMGPAGSIHDVNMNQ